jgi:hypothetical protein
VKSEKEGVMAQTHAFFASLNCPNPVTWTANIQGLFTQTDITHMLQKTNNALNLGDYNSVKVWATKIYQEVSNGAMPPAGSGENSWTPTMVNTFGCWIQQGCPQ